MAHVLILYATLEGHTGRIAERMALELRAAGHAVELAAAREGAPLPELGAFDAVIVGASVHYGHHPACFGRALRKQLDALHSRPSAFFSVSLSAGGPGANRPAAWRYVRKFLRATGWQPAQTAAFGGALRYSVLRGWKRFLVRLFVRVAGGDTDTSRDYEYTDWRAVAEFAHAFAAPLRLKA
jgi:menaquinone-dependent protoporphyrinogen oxidase